MGYTDVVACRDRNVQNTLILGLNGSLLENKINCSVGVVFHFSHRLSRFGFHCLDKFAHFGVFFGFLRSCQRSRDHERAKELNN